MDISNDNQEKKTNRSIFKAIGILGSMRVIQLLSRIVSSKFVALFIGPEGIGDLGLIRNVISLIESFTSFGYSIVSVKEIASAQGDKANEKIALTKKLSIYIGILGFAIMLASSSFLSLWIFGSANKFYWFVLLSLNFLLLSRNSFFSALMQGKRMMKVIAVSGTTASLLTTIVIIPIYYFLMEEGIIPAILVSNVILFLVNIYFCRHLKIKSYTGGFHSFFEKSKPMLLMGLVLSANLIVNHLCHFLLRFFFKNWEEDSSILGFYEVGITIITTYAGTIFSVMSVDFYPRISACYKDNVEIKSLVNKQIIISLLLVLPIASGFYLFDEFLILGLYSEKFLPVILIFKFGLLATVFKAIAWPLSYVILAKGNRTQFLKQEVIADILNIFLIIVLYLKFGLVGVGIGLTLEMFLYLLYVYNFINKSYQFEFDKLARQIIIITGTFVLALILINTFLIGFYSKGCLAIIFLASIYFSTKKLNEYINLKDYLVSKIFKRK